MADQDGRLAAGDHFRQPAPFMVGRDELVDRAGRETIPAAEPVAGAADDRDDASRVGAIQSRGILNARGHARSIGEKVPEIVGNLGLEDVAASFKRAMRQLRQRTIAEAARRRDPLASEPHVLEDPERIAHVFAELIGRLARAPAPVLHEVAVRSGNGRPVLVSITHVWLTISGWMSQLGIIRVRTSSRLALSSCFDQPGKSRSSQPTQAG